MDKQSLEELRAVIYKANPELMEECKVDRCYECLFEMKHDEAPIQLHNVLVAIKAKEKYWTTIEIIETFRTTLIAKFFKLWNLTKDFEGQEPEVHQFLYDILVTKK